MSDEGGDPACWLDQVCDVCGQVIKDGDHTCPRPVRVARSAADRLRVLFRIANRVEGLELRWLGTSGMAVLRRTDVLLLETTGRKTGRRRRAAVAYWRGPDGAYVIGGGAGGMTKVDWVANLRADPNARIWVRRRGSPVTATELRGDEYERVKEEALPRWPDIAKYEGSGRRIPYFRLTA